MSRDPKEVREQAMELRAGREFWAERMASAKAL